MGTYHKASFLGVSHIYLNLITCDYNIVILSILQSYALHWYHMYLLHPVMDKTEAIIFQHLYWPVIIEAVWKNVKIATLVNIQNNQIRYMGNYQLSNLEKYRGTNSV